MRSDNYKGDDSEGCVQCLPCPRPLTLVNISTLFGIDVSHLQGDVDWQKVKAAGVQFVFLKATEGGTYTDPSFAAHRAALKALGLPCGAYHFFRPKGPVDKQIDNFINAVGKLQPGELPPVLDIEVPEDWKGIAVPDRVKMILQWLNAVEKRLGMRPIVYINNPMARDELASDPALAKYLLWLAHYTTRPAPTVPKPWSNWAFWQYSEHGTIDGINDKEVDLNRFAGTTADLQKLLVPNSRARVRRRIVSWIARILGV